MFVSTILVVKLYGQSEMYESKFVQIGLSENCSIQTNKSTAVKPYIG
jgi:hypothetical protein